MAGRSDRGGQGGRFWDFLRPPLSSPSLRYPSPVPRSGCYSSRPDRRFPALCGPPLTSFPGARRGGGLGSRVARTAQGPEEESGSVPGAGCGSRAYPGKERPPTFGAWRYARKLGGGGGGVLREDDFGRGNGGEDAAPPWARRSLTAGSGAKAARHLYAQLRPGRRGSPGAPGCRPRSRGGRPPLGRMREGKHVFALRSLQFQCLGCLTTDCLFSFSRAGAEGWERF